MGIPPGVPVKAAQSIGPCPSYCRADCPGTQRPAHPPGACLAGRRRGSRRPHCDSYGKYSLSETDYLRRTCSGRRMTQMGYEERFPPQRLNARCGSERRPSLGLRRNGRDGAESAPSRHAFCVLTTRKHLETLGIDEQPLPLVEFRPQRPTALGTAGGGDLTRERRCKRITSSSAPVRPDASWPTVSPKTRPLA